MKFDFYAGFYYVLGIIFDWKPNEKSRTKKSVEKIAREFPSQGQGLSDKIVIFARLQRYGAVIVFGKNLVGSRIRGIKRCAINQQTRIDIKIDRQVRVVIGATG